jgi:transcriptional regulator of NAD metabolism
MGTRAYFMVNVADDVNEQEFVKILRELEDMTEVDFVDPVVGNWDMVIMIEAPATVEVVARKIEEQPWVKELSTLKIVSHFERHRAGKKELLAALVRQGV